jgi:hypothetical protein
MIDLSRLRACAVFALLLAPSLSAINASAQAQTISVRGIGPVQLENVQVRVVSVDRDTRNVVVERRGRQWRVAVPEEFGDLAALRRRDSLDINRVSGVAVSVSPSRNKRPDIVLSGGVTSGEFDGLPAKWVQRKVTVTGKFISLGANNTLTIDGPDGRRSIVVSDPAILQTLRGMKAGQMVDAVFGEAIQIVLQELTFAYGSANHLQFRSCDKGMQHDWAKPTMQQPVPPSHFRADTGGWLRASVANLLDSELLSAGCVLAGTGTSVIARATRLTKRTWGLEHKLLPLLASRSPAARRGIARGGRRRSRRRLLKLRS